MLLTLALAIVASRPVAVPVLDGALTQAQFSTAINLILAVAESRKQEGNKSKF